jgi:hypothetical protein
MTMKHLLVLTGVGALLLEAKKVFKKTSHRKKEGSKK